MQTPVMPLCGSHHTYKNYLDGLDVLRQGINEEISNGFPRLSYALSLLKGGVEFLHGTLDL